METLLHQTHHPILQLPLFFDAARVTPPPEKMMNPTVSTPLKPPVLHTDVPGSSIDATSISPLATITASPASSSSSSYSTSSTSSSSSDHRRTTSASSPRKDANSRPSLQKQNPIFHPRPYESLYAEQAYLSHSLQNCFARSSGMMKYYSSVEAYVKKLEPSKERRRLRKKLGLLKSKINETVEQERTILARLSELYLEIQSRQIWEQASHNLPERHGPPHYHLEALTPTAWSAMSPASYGLPSPYATTPSPMVPLNAASPDFVPSGYSFFFGHGQSVVQAQEYQRESSPLLETVDEAVEDGPEDFESDPTENGIADDIDDADSDDEASQKRRRSFDESIPSGRERRLSLPCLQFKWSDA